MNPALLALRVGRTWRGSGPWARSSCRAATRCAWTGCRETPSPPPAASGKCLLGSVNGYVVRRLLCDLCLHSNLASTVASGAPPAAWDFAMCCGGVYLGLDCTPVRVAPRCCRLLVLFPVIPNTPHTRSSSLQGHCACRSGSPWRHCNPQNLQIYVLPPCRVIVPAAVAGLPAALLSSRTRRTAVCDFLTRTFGAAVAASGEQTGFSRLSANAFVLVSLQSVAAVAASGER